MTSEVIIKEANGVVIEDFQGTANEIPWMLFLHILENRFQQKHLTQEVS